MHGFVKMFISLYLLTITVSEERSYCYKSESCHFCVYVCMYVCALVLPCGGEPFGSPRGWCGFCLAVWLRWLKAQLTLLLVMNMQLGGSLCAYQDCSWGTSTLSSTWMQTINLKFNGRTNTREKSILVQLWRIRQPCSETGQLYSLLHASIKHASIDASTPEVCYDRLQGPHCSSSTYCVFCFCFLSKARVGHKNGNCFIIFMRNDKYFRVSASQMWELSCFFWSCMLFNWIMLGFDFWSKQTIYRPRCERVLERECACEIKM